MSKVTNLFCLHFFLLKKISGNYDEAFFFSMKYAIFHEILFLDFSLNIQSSPHEQRHHLLSLLRLHKQMVIPRRFVIDFQHFWKIKDFCAAKICELNNFILSLSEIGFFYDSTLFLRRQRIVLEGGLKWKAKANDAFMFEF